MKKTLIALAALAATGAFAQSSVTLYGGIDLGYSVGTGQTTNKTAMTSGNVYSSRVGLQGTEDIGGGLKASFQLEGDVAPDSGAGAATNTNNQSVTALTSAGTQGFTFNRISTVGVSGGFGTVKLGRDYTPVFNVDGGFDPFAFNGAGATGAKATASLAGATQVRASNSIAYDVAVSGVQVRLMYGMGENSSGSTTSNDGNYTGWRIGYANGPLNVQFAGSRLSASTATTAASASAPLGGYAGDVDQTAFGASYDLGKVKPMVSYNRTNNSLANITATNTLVGLTAPMGSGNVVASYNRGVVQAGLANDATATKLAVGYVYDMSKRTSLYATYASLTNSNGANFGLNGATTTADSTSTGYDLGIIHKF